MKKILIFPLLALRATAYGQPIFGGTVQFYFSAAGGDDSRISEDQVTSSAWTNEYDILVKNVSGHAITFNQANVLVGFGRTTTLDPAVPIPGSDTIRERFGFTRNATFANNPNITWVPSWVSNFGTQTRLMGGWTEPWDGPVRPWGLNAGIFNFAGVTKTILNNEVLPLFRLSLRDNGLFAAQGINNLQLYNFPNQTGGSTTLRLTGTDNTYFYDNVNYFENSRLTLIAPEPGMLAILFFGSLGLIRLRKPKER